MELSYLNIPTAKINQIKEAGINSVEELLAYFPKKYFDFRTNKSFLDTTDGEVCSVIAMVLEVKKDSKYFMLKVIDEKKIKGTIMFFGQNYLLDKIMRGQRYVFCGRMSVKDASNNFKFYTMTPSMFSQNLNEFKCIIPQYKKIKKMSDEYLCKIYDNIFELLSQSGIPEYWDDDILKDFNLTNFNEAFKYIHKPKTMEEVEKARNRFVFDDLFKFCLRMKFFRDIYVSKTDIEIKSFEFIKRLKETLPFELTEDQKNAINYLYKIMKNKDKLNALIQGDVGSGKTIVAIMLSLIAIENGYQVAFLNPLEELAGQHYEGIKKLFDLFPDIKIALLTGSTKEKQKKLIKQEIEDGKINLVIGTHAIIQKDVNFSNLGLIIIDEQHKFGVEQREFIKLKYKNIHMATMSATPIPRTLAMTVYGDTIQLCNILTKPKGRKDIITKYIEEDNKIYDAMYEEIQKGYQCFVVCPLIEKSESDRMEKVKSVEQELESLKKYFDKKNIKISVITGKAKKEEIDVELEKFKNKETSILLATTIIEVGIDIKNATMIVIKNAERFGLSQLHQLRGRVGRNDIQSYCILQSDKLDKKIDALCKCKDGFEIAKKDLEMRGPGDFLGIEQSGDNKYISLMLLKPELYKNINTYIENKILKDTNRVNKYKKLFNNSN